MCFAAKEAQDHCQAEHKVSGSPFGGANRVNQDLRKQARKRKALASGKSFVGKKVLQEWESPGGSTAIDYEGCVCNWSASTHDRMQNMWVVGAGLWFLTRNRTRCGLCGLPMVPKSWWIVTI